MRRHKWIIGVRNKCASLACECDSCAAIEGAQLSRQERKELQELLEAPMKYIDNKLGLFK